VPGLQLTTALLPKNWIVLNWSFWQSLTRAGRSRMDEGIEVHGRAKSVHIEAG